MVYRLGSPTLPLVFKSLQQVIRKFAGGWFEGAGRLVPWYPGTCASSYSDTWVSRHLGSRVITFVFGYLGTQVSRCPGAWVQVITLVPRYLGSTWVPGYLDTRVPGYGTQAPGYLGAPGSLVPGYLGSTWVPGYLDTRVPGYGTWVAPG